MNIKTLVASALLCVSFASQATEITTHNIGNALIAHHSPQGYSLTVFSGDCVMNGETQEGAKPIVLRAPNGAVTLGCAGKTQDGRFIAIFNIDGVDRVLDISVLPFVKLQNS